MQKFMKNLITVSAISTISAVSAVSALADSDFSAKFGYSPADPVETTYARFEGIAKASCKLSRAEVADLGTRVRMEKACRTELINDAVKATNFQPLATYHAQMTTPSSREPLLTASK